MGKPITKGIVEQLNTFCKDGGDISSTYVLERWSSQVSAFLNTALGPDEAESFLSLTHNDEWQQHALRLGHLQGVVAKAEADRVQIAAPAQAPSSQPSTSSPSRRVFVVHGHDNEAKETTARFLEKLGLKPIILHEQPNSGRTIIEKFETYSEDIAFAVILLTPDDVGGIRAVAPTLSSRARQNVILELGYFMGRLGRASVCALHKGGVELPSDYQGIVYIEMDAPGAWRAKVAQELIQAKIPIDLSGLVGG